MKANCTDCDKLLPQIEYVRCLRPGQSRFDARDPLCKSCWEKDLVKIKPWVAKKEGIK